MLSDCHISSLNSSVLCHLSKLKSNRSVAGTCGDKRYSLENQSPKPKTLSYPGQISCNSAKVSGQPQKKARVKKKFVPSRSPRFKARKTFFKKSEVISVNGMKFETVYTNGWRVVDSWLKEQVQSENGQLALGFDTESRPSFKAGQVHPTATLQLATLRSCLVVHLVHAPSPVSAELASVLSDPRILKFGVEIDGDSIDLFRHYKLEVNGRCDLKGIRVDNKGNQGLKALTEAILGGTMTKNKKVTMSNWERCPLSDLQVQYAAQDAWVSCAMFEALRDYDADTFSIDSVAKMVNTERCVPELDKRQQIRKIHKRNLTAYLDSLAVSTNKADRRVLQNQIDEERKLVRKFGPGRSRFRFDLAVVDIRNDQSVKSCITSI